MTDRQFRLSLAGLFIFALVTRFGYLHNLPLPVFDEIYYSDFAQRYLSHTPFFDAHPPLGKYMIALGALFFDDRWMNAWVGSLLPVIVAGWLEQLTKTLPYGRWVGLWGGWYVALDGYLLVESRLNLINIYVIFFGVLSQWCWLQFLYSTPKLGQWIWTIAAGVMLGCSINVKWNGIAYGVGMLAMLGLNGRDWQSTKNCLGHLFLGLGILPLCTYFLLWIPHLAINSGPGFGQLHQQIINFHLNLGVGHDQPIHPYCSAWWTWPWLIRPIPYFYQELSNGSIQFLHGLGNPFLYWLSTLAVLGGIATGWLPTSYRRVLIYLLLAFSAHFFPWGFSQRCTFLYHYLPASVFAFSILALFTAFWREHSQAWVREVGAMLPPIVVGSFVLWLPLFWGITIPPWYYQLLIWFPSWV